VQVYAYKAPQGNVGDDLNESLWSRLLDGAVGGDDDTIFIGIGSVLDDRFSSYKHKVVAGAGARSFETSPSLDESWTVLFVRGPLTARALKLGLNAVLSDPALLIPHVLEIPTQHSRTAVGIVPYYSSDQSAWRAVCSSLGYEYISPHLSPADFLARLSTCKAVFAEAMHGAILADALSIPWRPLQSYNSHAEGPTHAFKWMDFCSSVGVDFDPIRLPPLPPNTSVSWSLKKRAFSEIIRRRLNMNLNAGGFRMSNPAVRAELVTEMLGRIRGYVGHRR
jgi:succinoglycan biosynthesis protein ExoV